MPSPPKVGMAQRWVSVVMSKVSSQDNFVAYVAAAVVVSLVSIFVFTWSQTRTNVPAKPEVSYSKFGPYVVENQNYSVTATITVQTSREDASWPNSNRQTLNVIFKKVLANIDAKTLKSPNNLQLIQDALIKGCDDAMPAKHVQAVLLTDFVIEPNGS